MTMTHQYCNEQFENFSIHEKRAVILFLRELQEAKRKHPNWPQDIIHASAIVSEEAGELTRATVNHTYERKFGDEYEIRNEAIQVGATAIRFLENLLQHSFFKERVADHPIYQT